MRNTELLEGVEYWYKNGADKRTEIVCVVRAFAIGIRHLSGGAMARMVGAEVVRVDCSPEHRYHKTVPARDLTPFEP